jgi:hypothetical protein
MMRYLAVAALLSAGLSCFADPIDVGDRKQLFIDSRFIAESEGVTLTPNPPVKRLRQDAGPLMAREINRRADHGAAFYDPTAPPERRYKRILLKGHMRETETAGLYIQYSPDRNNWTEVPERVFPFWPDGESSLAWDPNVGRYVAYFRQWIPRPGTDGEGPEGNLRTVGRLEIDDPLKPWPIPDDPDARNYIWGEHMLPAPGPAFEVVLQTDGQDPPISDFYDQGVFRYPWAEDVYFAFPVLYRQFPDSELSNDGLTDVQLAISRDGVNFRRFRVPYIDLGITGEDADGACIYVSRGLLRDGDEIRQYYAGYPRTHGHPANSEGNERFNGMVVQRLDGFVSADADYEGGELTTPEITFSGDRLQLNVDCSAAGDCRVEIRGADGAAIEGFALDDADPIRGNHIHRTVTWRDEDADVSALEDRPIRLRFVMRDCKLYAFQFVSGDGAAVPATED